MEGIDVLSNTYAALKKHPIYILPQLIFTILLVLMILAIALPLSSSLIAQNITNNTSSSVAVTALATSFVATLPDFLVVGVIMFLAIVLLNGMYIDLVSKWKNASASLSESVNVTLSRFVDLFLYYILIFVIEAAILFIVFAPSIGPFLNAIASPLSAASTAWIGASLGLLGSAAVCVVIGVILAPLFFTAPVIIMLENKGPITALKESIAIGRKDFLGILGVLVVFVVAYLIIAGAANAIAVIPVVGPLLNIVVSIFLPILTFVTAPMYYVTFVKTPKTKPASTRRRRKG